LLKLPVPSVDVKKKPSASVEKNRKKKIADVDHRIHHHHHLMVVTQADRLGLILEAAILGAIVVVVEVRATGRYSGNEASTDQI
jgi:hypothetical protein